MLTPFPLYLLPLLNKNHKKQKCLLSTSQLKLQVSDNDTQILKPHPDKRWRRKNVRNREAKCTSISERERDKVFTIFTGKKPSYIVKDSTSFRSTGLINMNVRAVWEGWEYYQVYRTVFINAAATVPVLVMSSHHLNSENLHTARREKKQSSNSLLSSFLLSCSRTQTIIPVGALSWKSKGEMEVVNFVLLLSFSHRLQNMEPTAKHGLDTLTVQLCESVTHNHTFTMKHKLGRCCKCLWTHLHGGPCKSVVRNNNSCCC